MKRKLILTLIFILEIQFIFSSIYFNEINQKGNKFIEIYSEENLNFNEIIFKINNQNINLTNIKNKSSLSKFYLLIENDSKLNIENLNCSILKINKNLEFENLSLINKNEENKNIFYENKIQLTQNKSYNFNSTNNQYFPDEISPCQFSSKQKSQNQFICSDLNFQINMINNYNKKLEFDFFANLNEEDINNKNFIIEYWIEDFFGNIIKNPNNTTNFNKKSYTPKSYNNYLIKSKLYYKNCTKQDLKIINFNQTYSDEPNYTYFNVITDFKTKDEKIKYKFSTNIDDYSIEYWIEDLEQNIIKDKRTTTNTNQKTYTPKKFSNIYVIKAKINGIYQENEIEMNTQQEIYFYYKNTNSDNSNEEKENNDDKDEDENKNSQIKIENKIDLVNLETDFLEYKIYRGDTNKRIVWFYLNKDKFFSVNIPKYETVYGKIKLPIKEEKNILVISGLDIEEDLTFFNDKNNSQKNTNKELIKNSNENKKLRINNFNIDDDKNILFNIETQLIDYSLLCYVNLLKTKVSNIFELNLTSNVNKKSLENIILNLDLDKIFEKTKKNSNEKIDLKLVCKFKGFNKNYFEYSSLDFIYENSKNIDSNQNKNKNSDTINISKEKIFSESTIKNNNLNLMKNIDYENKVVLIKEKNMFENNNLNNENLVNEFEKELIFKSKNQQNKENSYFIIFSILSFLSSIFVIFW